MPLRWVGGEGSQVPQPTLRSQLENLTRGEVEVEVPIGVFGQRKIVKNEEEGGSSVNIISLNGIMGFLFQVDWECGHFSSFPLDWLKERSFREEARALYREKV